jgi:DNA primase
MALPPQFLDELRGRTSMHALVARKVRLQKSGRQWKGCCPFHGEKTPSFYVYEDGFHCFGCGAHGDAISFVMRADGASFIEAVERLAGEAGLNVPKPTPEVAAREARARDLHGVLDAAQAAFTRRLHLPEGRAALDYLLRRGLTDKTIADFGLGWSGAGRGALAADLRELGIETAQLIEAGLMQEREQGPVDLFFNRVMFPIHDRRGRGISFGGRIMGDGQPKYVNGPETPLFSKRRQLYGLHMAREGVFRGARLVAVEGYMDVIALHQAGFTGAVAPLGTALTTEQLEALWAVSPEPVLCFDGDGAGARAAARAAETALPLLTPERTLRLATLPAGEDPDTLIGKQGAGAFEAVLRAALPLGEALYNLLAEGRALTTPEERAGFRARLSEAANTIADKGLASEYRRALLDRFFAAGRPQKTGRAAPPRAIARPVPGANARSDQARAMLACLLRHPWFIPEVEEALGLVTLPPGPAPRLRDHMLGALGSDALPDAAALQEGLRAAGLSSELDWALSASALPAGARDGAQPADVEQCFWHFFSRLRGDEALQADLSAARRDAEQAPTTEALRRVALLKEALDAYGRGDPSGVEAG